MGKTETLSLAVSLLAFTYCGGPSKKEAIEVKADSVQVLASNLIFNEDRPFLQAHASTLVRTNDGHFLAAWFGGTHEKHDDVGIWLSKGTPDSWSFPVEVAKIRQDPHWNPVLYKEPSGKIILYFKVGRTIDDWETWFITSDDNGRTWTEPAELVVRDKGGRGPVRNKPILLSDGTLLAGSSRETQGIWNAFVDRSEDGGNTWKTTPFLEVNRDSVPGEGIIQPTLWESAPGNVHMLLRSSAGFICRSDSKDGGLTWSPVYKTNLPNPNSGIDLTKLDNGTLVLAFNNSSGNWGPRRPITLAISQDNGFTWPVKFDVETGQEGDEFSYPAIISFEDTVALTYTWKRQNVAFRLFKIQMN